MAEFYIASDKFTLSWIQIQRVKMLSQYPADLYQCFKITTVIQISNKFICRPFFPLYFSISIFRHPPIPFHTIQYTVATQPTTFFCKS